MHELVGTAMDNLALAAVTKQTTLDMLAQSNTTLAKVNAEQQNTITKLTKKITALEKKLEQSSVGGGGGGTSKKMIQQLAKSLSIPNGATMNEWE